MSSLFFSLPLAGVAGALLVIVLAGWFYGGEE